MFDAESNRMGLDASWVAAIASVASAVVVAVTAIAAFAQIRQARNSNEITVYLRLVDRLDAIEARGAFAGLDELVTRVRTDATFRQRLQQPDVFEEIPEVAALIRFLEHLSTLVVTGGVTERLILAEYADNLDAFWDRLAELIYLRRETAGPYFGAALEHVAMRARRYIANGEMARLYGRLDKDPRMAGRGSTSKP